MFLKNRNISSKIKRSKVTDYAALSGMLGIIQSKIADFEDIFCYPCYVLCCLFLPILMSSQSFFLNFGQGALPKIAGKSLSYDSLHA